MEPMNPYVEIDFAEAWKSLSHLRAPASTSEGWDKRAENYDKRGKPGGDAYRDRFIELLDIREGETVLDMGCGTGLIALALAKEGHSAICADFSQGMLDILEEKLIEAKDAGDPLHIIRKRMAWEDDWMACGIQPNSVDVAYASRSMAVEDLGAAVDNLSRTARRRCAATVSCSGSPRCNDAILAAAGRESASRFDTAFLVDVLWQRRYLPEVDYIDSGRIHTYPTRDALLEDAILRLDEHSPVNPDEKWRLALYVSDNARQNADGEWVLDEFNNARWAFVAWDVSGRR